MEGGLNMERNNNRTTGAELIARERQEQIVKHGFDETKDQHYYANGELLDAANFCLGTSAFPSNWNEMYADKIMKKNKIDKLKVAGALIAAEMDRLISLGMQSED